MPFCTNCGKENMESSRFCIECGKYLTSENQQNYNIDSDNVEGIRTREKVYAVGKKPMLSLILSLLIVGLGQFYNGDAKKGGLMLAGAVLGGILSASILWWVMAIWSAYDAYQVASQSTPLWK